MAGSEPFASIGVAVMPGALRVEANLPERLRITCCRGIGRPILDMAVAADRLDLDRLDEDVLGFVDESEAVAMGLLERLLHRCRRAGRDRQRSVRAGIAD